MAGLQGSKDGNTDSSSVKPGPRQLEPLSLSDLEAREELFHSRVLSTAFTSPVCSGLDWAVSAANNLHEDHRPRTYWGDSTCLAFLEGPFFGLPDVLIPFESYWRYASPLIGPDLGLAAAQFSDLLETSLHHIQAVLIGGILEEGVAELHLRTNFADRFRIDAYLGMSTMLTSLEGGFEQFLKRRDSKFVKSLEKAQKQSEKLPLSVDYYTEASSPESLFLRLLEVEKCSWKYSSFESIFQQLKLYGFYEEVFERSAKSGRLRLLFLQHEGRDVAYVFGVVLGDCFRGLQMSYHSDYKNYSLGHLAQYELIQNLVLEGIKVYDLGMEMDYKKKWSDQTLQFVDVVLLRDGLSYD